MPTRSASAVWNGSLTEGNGTMRMASGAYEEPRHRPGADESTFNEAAEAA